MKKSYLLLIGIIFAMGFSAPAQNITTIAGNGTPGMSGDSGLATSAQLNGPFGIAVDQTGNVYVADRFNNRIRKVNTTGIISTIAGTGTGGYSGDGGPATDAQINNITGVAVDNSGNVYIADKGNNRIRKVDASGIITTIGGSGMAGYSGDGGPATDAMLNIPFGVAVDGSSNVYIAEVANNVIRKISATGIVTTIAGNGTAGYSGDGGPAALSQLRGTYAVATDTFGNIYISDVDNERIRKVDASGTISTFAGTGTSGFSGDDGPANLAQLSEPIGVTTDGQGNVLIADGWNSRIRRVNGAGTITTIAGNGAAGYSGDGGPAVLAQLRNPYGVATDASGAIYIADYGNHAIRYMTRPVSVPSMTLTRTAEVYPNPSNGKFTVNLNSGTIDKAQIAIVNVLGQVVKELTLASSSIFEIELPLPFGVYFLNISTERGTFHGKITIVQ